MCYLMLLTLKIQQTFCICIYFSEPHLFLIYSSLFFVGMVIYYSYIVLLSRVLKENKNPCVLLEKTCYMYNVLRKFVACCYLHVCMYVCISITICGGFIYSTLMFKVLVHVVFTW